MTITGDFGPLLIMKTILLSLATTLAIVPTAHAFDAETYTEGLKNGSVIATCMYLQRGDFKDPNFGAFMLKEQFNLLPQYNQTYFLDSWREDNNDKCIEAVGY